MESSREKYTFWFRRIISEFDFIKALETEKTA